MAGHTNGMRTKAMLVAVGLFTVAQAVFADEKLPRLQVGSEVYSNATVTKVTATDIYFMHARGFGNAKLKNLSPDLQKHFGYDPGWSSETEKKQAEANAQYQQAVLAGKPLAARPPVPEERAQSEQLFDGDIAVPTFHARSFLRQAAPALVVEKWLTAAPDTSGKFVLIDFWATWCGPCRQSIPHLNAIHAKTKDRVVIIGLSDETEAEVRQMQVPKIDYYVAIDTHRRMLKTVEVKGIPHAMLTDPAGIVRFEGMPSYLDQRGLERLLKKYSN